MRIARQVVLAAAVVAAATFGAADAGAWGSSRNAYGSHSGFDRHLGFGPRFGIGRRYGFGRQFGFSRRFGFARHYGYGRHHGFRGRGHPRRGHAFPPAYPRPARPAPTASTADPSSVCRKFTTDIVIDGAARKVIGTACRQADGRWRIVDWR